jgi:hypothetical protein
LNADSRQFVQLAEQQGDVVNDVSQAATDVERAARHERRLGKAALAEPLDKAAQRIQRVADDETASAQQTLVEAAAPPAPAESPSHLPTPRDAELAVKQSQQAITREADQLGEILNPSASTTASNAPATTAGNANSPAPSGSAAPPTKADPAAAARGEFLARTLDELDRTMAQAARGDAGPPSPSDISTLAQAAQTQSAGLARARAQNRAIAVNAPTLVGPLTPTDGATASAMATPEFLSRSAPLPDNESWGKLREQSAEDLVDGQREAVSAEYRHRIETYFRVIGERARRKN